MTFDETHERRSPDVAKLLGVLSDHDVRFVIAGSVAAQIYGVELVPGDFDIVPALDRKNLVQVCEVLRQIEARPPGPFGAWTTLPNGEWKWIARDTTAEEIAAWEPNPDNINSLDNLYLTRHGDFDVVPEIMGNYEFLKVRAVQIPFHSFEPWVAHIDDLLSRNTVPRREKDVPRVAALREIQRARGLVQ